MLIIYKACKTNNFYFIIICYSKTSKELSQVLRSLNPDTSILLIRSFGLLKFVNIIDLIEIFCIDQSRTMSFIITSKIYLNGRKFFIIDNTFVWTVKMPFSLALFFQLRRSLISRFVTADGQQINFNIRNPVKENLMLSVYFESIERGIKL